MPESFSFFTECFKEVQYQFPGSSPHTLEGLADRLYRSLVPQSPSVMTRTEVFRRCRELSTALGTIPQWRGWKLGDGRFINAKDED